MEQSHEKPEAVPAGESGHTETPTAAISPQKQFMAVWKRFMKTKGLDSSPAMFNRGVMDVYKLFRLVMSHGGFKKVSEGKLWARIGRAFNPPQSMTDLSYQTKKVYISKLLAFEEAYTNGEVSVVLEADSEPESQEPPPSSRNTYPSLKNTTLKRKYGDAYITSYGEVPAARELLVGKTISVWWNAEGSFHVGNVVQYHPELDQYTIEYESGEVHQTDLKGVHWVPADGGLPMGSSQSSQPGAPENEPVTKVYASTTSIPGFEIFTSLPGIRLEEVSVRCWPEGRLLIQGDPDLATPGSAQKIQEELQLPLLPGQKLLPRTAQALFTDTGRLYVKVEATHPSTSQLTALGPKPASEAAVGRAY